MKNRSGRSEQELQQIFDRLMNDRKELMQRIIENDFTTVEDGVSSAMGIQAYIGIEILKLERPLSNESWHVYADILDRYKSPSWKII